MWTDHFRVRHVPHCVKSVWIRSYSGLHFSCIFPHSDWVRRDNPYLSVFSPMRKNAGKMRTTITPNTNTFYAVPFSPIDNFFKKTVRKVSMYLLVPFIVQNLKKVLKTYPKLWGRAIFRLLNEIFFRKAISKPCRRVHLCLSTCKKLESDLNPLMRHRLLKNTENLIGRGHFWP